MCEFCLNPSNTHSDAHHVDFKGFFSADAIEAAVVQARGQKSDDDSSAVESEDSDGT